MCSNFSLPPLQVIYASVSLPTPPPSHSESGRVGDWTYVHANTSLTYNRQFLRCLDAVRATTNWCSSSCVLHLPSTGFLTSHDCMAVSIDTCTALARFIRKLTVSGFRYLRVVENPYPNPSKPLPLGTGTPEGSLAWQAREYVALYLLWDSIFSGIIYDNLFRNEFYFSGVPSESLRNNLDCMVLELVATGIYYLFIYYLFIYYLFIYINFNSGTLFYQNLPAAKYDPSVAVIGCWSSLWNERQCWRGLVGMDAVCCQTFWGLSRGELWLSSLGNLVFFWVPTNTGLF